MKVKHKIEIFLENYPCVVLCENDFPIGQLYDFACALKHFATEKISEYESKKEEKVPDENER